MDQKVPLASTTSSEGGSKEGKGNSLKAQLGLCSSTARLWWEGFADNVVWIWLSPLSTL